MRAGKMLLLLVVMLFTAKAYPDEAWSVHLAPQGGAHRMFTHVTEGRTARDPKLVLLRLTINPVGSEAARAHAVLTAEDIFGQPIPWKEEADINVPAGGKPVDRYVPLLGGPGYYSIRAEVRLGDAVRTAWTDLGIVPGPHPGPRPDSFFASNTSGMKTGEDLELLEAIGMKVERVHFTPDLAVHSKDWPRELPPGQAVPLDFIRQDKQWAETKARGLWALPVAGYALSGANAVDSSELAQQLGMYGPPADYDRFIRTWEVILRHYPELTTMEFWNEPWIFGWTWAATPGDYRRFQKQFCEMALKVNPHYRIVAGNSTMFVADNIEPDPACWRGLLQGISHHPYARSSGEASYRPGDHLRTIDETLLIARRMKLPRAYLTEGGTEYRHYAGPEGRQWQKEVDAANAEMRKLIVAGQQTGPQWKELQAKVGEIRQRLATLPDPANNNQDAAKVVQYYVKSALAGLFQGNAQWQIGYGPGWTRPNTTFAVMTHFLEDRPPLADIWPAHELIEGGIFANPRFVTDAVRQLPRAAELSARWQVPIPNDRADDKAKVAVLWSLTGASNGQLDTKGTLTLADGRNLKAFDMTGREIRPQGSRLVVPFGSAPVYITTEALGVVELRDRIASARIENVTPVNLYALSLGDAASRSQNLSVRIENQLNRSVQGVLRLKVNGVEETTSTPFAIDAARLSEVQVPWPATPATPSNQYGVTLAAEIEPLPLLAAVGKSVGKPGVKPKRLTPVVVSRQQIVSVARFVRRAIKVDGNLDDWHGITPVVLDSRMLKNEVDLSQYLLNPNLDKPSDEANDKRIVARVYTAYDDAHVFLAAVVQEDSFSCDAGQPVVKGRGETKVTLPYKNGMPDGLNHVVNAGDVLQFSFGFRDRVPGCGRSLDDPYAWKGCFYDTDASYVAHISPQGDQLIRIWGADTARRNGYQTEAVPGQGPVRGGKVKIVRHEATRQTIYEMSIPRSELQGFDPAAGRCRFGFILYNDERLGEGNGLNWSDAAGVFDHWRNFGSFPPTWMQRTACQTFFGIEPSPPSISQ